MTFSLNVRGYIEHDKKLNYSSNIVYHCSQMLSRLGATRELLFVATAHIIALVIAGGVGLGTAQAREKPYPTDVDLRAAFCAPYVAYNLKFIPSMQSILDSNTVRGDDARLLKQSIEEFDWDARRVRAYLTIRIMEVEPELMLAAIESGKRAIDKRERCLADSQSSFNFSGDVELERRKRAEDTKSCLGPDLLSRLASCEDLGWLPF